MSLTDLKAEKIKPTVGLHHIERKLLQIGLATNNEEILRPFQPYIKDGVYLDAEGLQKEMKEEEFTASSLIHEQENEIKAMTVDDFYKQLIKELKEKGQIGNYK